MRERLAHDYLTHAITSTVKLTTEAGFELAPSGTPVRRSIPNIFPKVRVQISFPTQPASFISMFLKK